MPLYLLLVNNFSAIIFLLHIQILFALHTECERTLNLLVYHCGESGVREPGWLPNERIGKHNT